MLYLKSELTDNQLRIYADNIAMARWLQSTVQGMLNAATADLTIPVIDAVSRSAATRATTGPNTSTPARITSRSPGATPRATAGAYLALRPAGATLRRVHHSHASAWGAADGQRQASEWPRVAARARGSSL